VSPAATATAGGVRNTSRAADVLSVLTASRPMTEPSTSGRWSSRKPRSSSIPTETKNAALKMICSGRISTSACELKRDSETSRPARKAPSDTETPASEVA
jgi:hypothetical protein